MCSQLSMLSTYFLIDESITRQGEVAMWTPYNHFINLTIISLQYTQHFVNGPAKMQWSTIRYQKPVQSQIKFPNKHQKLVPLPDPEQQIPVCFFKDFFWGGSNSKSQFHFPKQEQKSIQIYNNQSAVYMHITMNAQ